MYVNSLKDDIRDNRRSFTPKEIMAKAVKKSEELKKDRKFDQVGDKKGDHILALEAKLDSVTRKFDKITKAFKGSSTKAGKRGQRTTGASFPAELRTGDKPEDTTIPKVINGVNYWWCTTHDKWGIHSTNDCRKRKAREGAAATPPDSSSSNANRDRAIRAVQALIDEESDDE
jgi:hypothetical protein